MSRPKLTVAISGFSGTCIAEPGSAVANALRNIFKDQIKIVALAYSSWTNAAFTPGLVNEIRLIEPLGHIDNHYHDLARTFHACHPDIYIPTLELEVKYLHYFLNRFREQGPKALIPDVTSFDRTSKLGLHYFCNDNQYLYPKTIVTNNYMEFHYNIMRQYFPCLIKSALNGAILVNTLQEAYDAAQKLSASWTQPVLIQEYIAGDQYMVAALFDEKGSVIKSIFARKHLINRFGKSAITLMVNHQKLQTVSDNILYNLNWRGPLELEFIRDVNDNFYLFEINPRFPSWVDIASSIENNLPALLVNYLNGKRLSQSTQNHYHDVLVRDIDEVCIPIDHFYHLQKKGTLQLTKKIMRKSSSYSTASAAIAISGVSAYHLPMPGLSLAKALKNHAQSLKLTCLAEHYHDTGCYRSDLFHRVYQLDLQAKDAELLEQVKKLVEHDPLQAIIPTIDRHVEIFIKHVCQFNALGIKLLLPTLESLQRVYRFPFFKMEKKKIPSPISIMVKTIDDVNAVTREIGYPIVLKTLGSDKSCVNIIFTPGMINSLYTIISNTKNTQFMLQQFIEGERFSVFGLASQDSQLLENSIVIKVAQSCMFGKAWMATHIQSEMATPFLSLLSDIITELEWKGPIEIDCIRDKYHETIYCIDINPRFPSWIFYASVIQPKILSHYLNELLGYNNQHTHTAKQDYMYVRLPRNYVSDIGTLGKLMSGKILEYHE